MGQTILKHIGSVTLLAGLSIIIWAWQSDRLNHSNWQTPTEYNGDALQILGWTKAAMDGDYAPFKDETIPKLGAPYGANWNDYPMYEKCYTYGMGLAARMFGLYAAANIGIALSHALAAISLFYVARRLGAEWIWSIICGLLFGETCFFYFRNLAHLLLALPYTIPLALLASWMIAGVENPNRRFIISIGVLMGLSNPYNLFMYGQLVALGVALVWMRSRDWNAVKMAAMTVGAAAMAFIAINANTIAYSAIHGKGSAIVRSYFEYELYGLKLMDLIVPPSTHNVPALAAIGADYFSKTVFKGETAFSPYLGIIALCGLLWAGWELARKRFNIHSIQAAWVLAYSTVGGLNCILALAGLMLFRASNRYSIFLSAIALLFLAVRLSALCMGWKRWSSWSLAVLVLTIGLFDQVPRRVTPNKTAAIAQHISNDRDFAKTMEANLPPHSMVFQLPVMVFPDAEPTYGLEGYEQLRPYINGSTLKWSFGSNRGREREKWQEIMPILQPSTMVIELKARGFSAIYLNRKGFADGGDALIQSLSQCGLSRCVVDSERLQFCFIF